MTMTRWSHEKSVREAVRRFRVDPAATEEALARTERALNFEETMNNKDGREQMQVVRDGCGSPLPSLDERAPPRDVQTRSIRRRALCFVGPDPIPVRRLPQPKAR